MRMAGLIIIMIAIFTHCDNDEPVSTPDHNPDTQLGADSSSTASPPDITDFIPPGQSDKDSAYYQYAQSNIPYRIMVPAKFDSTKKYPLVIFLHGIDQRGSDNNKQLRWGASVFQLDSIRSKYPSFVVFPQCPANTTWFNNGMLSQLKTFIDQLLTIKSIDQDRVYIEGLSMGAYGIYAFIARYPEVFTAAITISGDGDKSKADRMASVAWKIYGGEKDEVVSASKCEAMAEALSEAGAVVSLKIFPGAGHSESWERAFVEPDYFSWIFSKTKRR